MKSFVVCTITLAGLTGPACGDDSSTLLHPGPAFAESDLTKVFIVQAVGGASLDVVVWVNDTAVLRVFEGDGDGELGDPATTTGVGNVTDIGDITQDGVPDYLAGTTLWLGEDDGTVARASTLDVEPNDLYLSKGVLADVTGDGLGDAVFAEPPNLVTIWAGDGMGGFATKQPYAVPYPVDIADFYQIAAARVTDDAALDVLRASHTSLDGLLASGDGEFVTVPGLVQFDADYPQVSTIVVFDINGDSLDDVAIEVEGRGAVLLATNQGDGTYSGPSTLVAEPGPAPLFNFVGGLVAADFDGDGCPDLAFLGTDDSDERYVFAMLSSCSGAFLEPIRVARTDAAGFAAGDLDGDARADVVTTRAELFLSR